MKFSERLIFTQDSIGKKILCYLLKGSNPLSQIYKVIFWRNKKGCRVNNVFRLFGFRPIHLRLTKVYHNSCICPRKITMAFKTFT